MEKITCYRAHDGSIFDSEEQCSAHERSLRIRGILEDEACHGKLEVDQVIDIIERHKVWFLKYFKELGISKKPGH